MTEEIRNLLQSVYGEPIKIESTDSTGGGCINQTQILILSNGKKLFLKSHTHPPPGFFKKEALGLELLGSVEDGPRVPCVVAPGPGDNPHYLILEYVQERPPDKEFYARFGRAMAALHQTTRDHHGLDHDNFIGKTVQRNTPEKDGLVFFRDHRVRFQQELARKAGLLPKNLDRELGQLCDKMEHLLDLTGEKPALLHGDLWSGNYFSDGKRPCFFDPAVYFGLREADLAMMELFGSVPQSFYNAYNEAFPMNPGYEERKELFNLYHLLNHLNLFGGSYLSSVERTVHRFTR